MERSGGPRRLDEVLGGPSWLRMALDIAQMGAWDYDITRDVLTRSPGFDQMFGLDPDRRVSIRDVLSRCHPDHRRRLAAEIRGALNGSGRTFRQEFRVLQADGPDRWLSARGEIIRDEGGKATRTIGVVQDISEHKQALEQKDLLLQEISHRVKNNLNMIGSLLNLQAIRVADPAARHQFDQAVRRVGTVASMHAALYQSADSPSHLDFAAYLHTLAEALRETLGSADERIRLSVAADEARVPVETALPLGMCLNELVTNAVKHGFAPGANGHVRIVFRCRPDGSCHLIVADNGRGAPVGIDQDTGGLGFRLIRSLARQIGGQVSIENDDGLVVIIDVPSLATPPDRAP